MGISMLESSGSQRKTFPFDRMHGAISSLRRKQIFFVGGPPKSGTTWLQLLLDAHPQISCRGEAHFIDFLAPSINQGLNNHWNYIDAKNRMIFHEIEGYPRLLEEDFLYILASCIALYLLRQSKGTRASAIGERTPDNVEHLEMLDLLFPTAKFIQIVRDGRDCAVSAWFHNVRVTPEWTKEKLRSLDAYVARYAVDWAKRIAAAQHFAARHRDRFFRVRYEDLVTDPEGTLTKLFRFLGVSSGEAVLARCRSEAEFAKLSGGRSPGQEDRGSFFRKGVPGDWRNHLTPVMETEFRKQAGQWLDRLGYN
jgi:hypothetical protein